MKRKNQNENVDTKNITNKRYHETPINTYITLIEDEKSIKNEYAIANIFNTFFIETVPNLD